MEDEQCISATSGKKSADGITLETLYENDPCDVQDNSDLEDVVDVTKSKSFDEISLLSLLLPRSRDIDIDDMKDAQSDAEGQGDSWNLRHSKTGNQSSYCSAAEVEDNRYGEAVFGRAEIFRPTLTNEERQMLGIAPVQSRISFDTGLYSETRLPLKTLVERESDVDLPIYSDLYSYSPEHSKSFASASYYSISEDENDNSNLDQSETEFIDTYYEVLSKPQSQHPRSLYFIPVLPPKKKRLWKSKKRSSSEPLPSPTPTDLEKWEWDPSVLRKQKNSLLKTIKLQKKIDIASGRDKEVTKILTSFRINLVQQQYKLLKSQSNSHC